MRKTISIVIPVFNEEENLREFYTRLTKVMSEVSYDYDIIFVDDGSRDASSAILYDLSQNDEHVQAYLL